MGTRRGASKFPRDETPSASEGIELDQLADNFQMQRRNLEPDAGITLQSSKGLLVEEKPNTGLGSNHRVGTECDLFRSTLCMPSPAQPPNRGNGASPVGFSITTSRRSEVLIISSLAAGLN
jgi:hypothetical protein